MWARLKLLVMRLMPMPSVMVSCGFLRRLPSASSLVYMTPRVTCTGERGEVDALPQPCQWQLPQCPNSQQVSLRAAPAHAQEYASSAAKLAPGVAAKLSGDRKAYALLSQTLAHFVIQTGAWGVNEVDSDG